MEDLEKDKCSCGCCPQCDCGDDCHCTPDNKCCDECTCDENCHSHSNCDGNDNCACEDKCECDENGNCDNTCECNKDDKCIENCTCDEDLNCNCNEQCDCGEDCDCSEHNKCSDECDCNTTQDADNDSETDEKCKCGCGESVEEETTADAYFRQLLSLRAEFDNYRKRTQNDISKAYSNGFNQAIAEFLPALDSFKMASEYITDPNTLMGIQYIEKGILLTLEKMGVKAIDVSGKFDPNFHQAIGSEVSANHESGDIIKECFKGFTVGEKVIRYSQVIVAK